MNAAHSIAPQAPASPISEAKVERQGPREVDASTIHHLPPSRLEIASEPERDARWPGYVRVPLIIGSAVVAWGVIIVAALRFFH
jgi:hypothetical protein